jgi:tetratricopeptide (TPR) repeat protein
LKNQDNIEVSKRAAPNDRRRPAPLLIRPFFLLIVLLIGTSFGCAYYNTFYYARRYYNEAEELQSKSKADVLSQQAKAKYDKSIEKCLKVIVEYGGGWKAGIDDALFLMGACYYGKREYETAIKKFNELILNYPESEHIEEALFFTGQSYFKLRNVATAQRVYARILRDNPSFSRRDEIIISVAEALESDGEYLPAARQYRIIVEQFKDSEKRELALERMGEIYFDQGYFDSSLLAFEELSQITQDDELFFEAQLKLGSSRMRLHDHDGALEIYKKILPERPESDEKGGRVWLALAEAENRAGNYDKALEYLGFVSEHFASRTTLGLEADFRIGYTNEVYLKDYTASRSAYEKAVRSTQRSVFKDQAQRRLQNVTRLEQLQSSGEEGEETNLDNSAMAALQVAEFSYFESDDIEEALALYKQVTTDYPGTMPARRAGFARGWIYYNELDSLSASVEEFEQIADGYPDSDQAKRALDLMTEIGLTPPERLQMLREKVSIALAQARARRDSVLADSLLAAQALADSLALVQEAAVAAAAAAADSLGDIVFPVSHPDSIVAAPTLDELRTRRDAMRGIQGGTDSLMATSPLDSIPPHREPTEIERLREAHAIVDSMRNVSSEIELPDSMRSTEMDSSLTEDSDLPLTPEQQRERARQMARENSETRQPATRLLPEQELQMNRHRVTGDSLIVGDSLTTANPDSTEEEDQ